MNMIGAFFNAGARVGLGILVAVARSVGVVLLVGVRVGVRVVVGDWLLVVGEEVTARVAVKDGVGVEVVVEATVKDGVGVAVAEEATVEVIGVDEVDVLDATTVEVA